VQKFVKRTMSKSSGSGLIDIVGSDEYRRDILNSTKKARTSRSSRYPWKKASVFRICIEAFRCKHLLA